MSCIAGELAAQFKFTLLLMPNGPMKITGLTFDESLFESENSVTDEEMKVTTLFDEMKVTTLFDKEMKVTTLFDGLRLYLRCGHNSKHGLS